MNILDNNTFKVRSDVEKLAPAILEIMEVTRDNGVDCWLNYGALLGMVREKRLLPWNNDAELSCWNTYRINEKFISITDKLNELGYYAIYYSSIGSIGVKSKGVVVNINIYWPEGSLAVRPHELPSTTGSLLARIFYWLSIFMGSYPKKFDLSKRLHLPFSQLLKVFIISIFSIFTIDIRKIFIVYFINVSKKLGGIYQKTGIPAIYFKDFKMIKFYGSNAMVPKNSNDLLEFIYGKNWNIPMDNWSFYHDENKSKTGIKFLNQMWNYKKMDIV